jgi:Rab GDP dissociation inhibitor
MAVCKVPSNDMEALKSNLMGMFEKKRVIGLYKFIQNVNPENPMTWDGIDIKNAPMSEVFKKHNLEEGTIDFMGHAVALHH